ncbi:ABC transporter permease [Nocardioides insulae]|uniref:ABC transporter permease n=1 Tax=Nocardioides insulae TaxID=394734 RepID=UPI00041E4175|nr:ABC transporter permease [Nocardioides insulae]
MKDALLAEYRKLLSTRMWWLLVLVMAAYLAFIGLVMAFAMTVETPSDPEGAMASMFSGEELAQGVYGLINSIGYVFPLLIGSLAMTTEFRHKTITQSLLVEPRRNVFLTAKILATVPVGLIYGLVGLVALVASAAPILSWQGEGAYLGAPDVWEGWGLSLLVMVLWTIIGVTVGTMLPNQVAAIVVILGVTQFVEPIMRAGLSAFEATQDVAQYLPAAAADAIIGSGFFSAAMGGASDTLSRPGGIAVMLAYALTFALIGRFTTLRRDIG